MPPTRPLLVLALLAGLALADQETCKGRCMEGFNKDQKCQCDELCSYYQSCCPDYMVECKRQVTRGDVFTRPEDEYSDYEYETQDNASSTYTQLESITRSPELLSQTSEQTLVLNPENKPFKPVTAGPEEATRGPEETGHGLQPTNQEELCSGKPFDAFTDLKNGSLFAFRGQYCYELDEKAVRPGYPKLIRDVWGIEGPIDAAFTRINCQGKTYLFKGSQYWLFEDGILDPDYPRAISDGFHGIPDNVDAALALPAHSYSGRERVYFFKGKQYWLYEFQQQPSQEECEGSAQSAVFTHFARIRDPWSHIFELLFWGDSVGGAGEAQLISEDWQGLPEKVDAAMAGHIYISGSTPRSSWAKKPKRKSRRNRKRYRSHRSRSQKRSRQSRSILSRFWLSSFSSEESDLGTYSYNYGDYDMGWQVPASCKPIQSVYFFSGDKYYRVNLRTRRVDTVTPPYPRSIAQYWLGCPAPDNL